MLTVHVVLTARPARAPSLEIAAAALVSVARALLIAERAVNPPSAHALPTKEAFRLTELAERTERPARTQVSVTAAQQAVSVARALLTVAKDGKQDLIEILGNFHG